MHKEPPLPKNIVLIDDDLEFIKMLGDSLELEGYRISLFQDPRLALEAVRREPVALVITDFHMKEMTAIDVVLTIRACNADLPVLVVSGNPDPEIEKAALGYGARAFLTKPLDLERLMTLVEEFC